jgi:branched-chain amino acid transport system substrate-binding protein
VRRGAVALIVVAAVLAASRASGSAAAPATPCDDPRLGLLAPLTGPAAFLGKEQLALVRHAVRTVGRREVRLVEADTQLDPARAARAFRDLRRRPNVLAVVGPAGSQEVLAAARAVPAGERLALVSASAVQPELTNGSIPTFFRVVPSERAQAPTVARLIARRLRATRVAVVDDGSGYARRLADRVQARLRAGGAAATRLRVDAEQTEFAAAAARVPRSAQAVFLAFHVAATAQLFAEALRRGGSEAAVVGSDTLDSRDFTVAGAYVATFAPRVRVPGHTGRTTKFGPPAYVAAEVALRAVRSACADGAATRGEVLQRLRATDLRGTVLGRIRFTRGGDVRGASYAVRRLP